MNNSRKLAGVALILVFLLSLIVVAVSRTPVTEIKASPEPISENSPSVVWSEFPSIEPRYVLLGDKTRLWSTTFGTYVMDKSTPYVMSYSDRAGNPLIDKSMFWVETTAVIDPAKITDVRVLAENDNVFRIGYSATYKGGSLTKDSIVGNFTVTYAFYKEKIPKISVQFERTENWTLGGLGDFNVVWVLLPVQKFVKIENEAMDLTTVDLTLEGTRCEIGSSQNLEDWINWTLVAWEDVGVSVFSIGSEKVWGGKGITVKFPTNLASIDPSVVSTSTTYFATSYPSQRKIFYAAGRYWVFYSDGTNIVYRVSTDGATWSSAYTVGSGTYGYNFSLHYDGTYIHYARLYGNEIYYRRGVPNADNTITWSAAEQKAVAISGSANVYSLGSIGVSDNEVFIGYTWYDGAYYRPSVTKATVTDGTWTTSDGFPYVLHTSSYSTWLVIPVGLTSGKCYVIYSCSATPGYGRLWDGSSWGSQEMATGYCFYSYSYSVVAQGDNVFVVYNDYDYVAIRFRKRTYGVGWETMSSIQTNTSAYTSPSLTLDPSTGDLYCFWYDTPVENRIYYKKYTASTATWDASPTEFYNETEGFYSTNGNLFNTSYWVQNNRVMISWTSKTASPYNVKFDTLFIAPAPEWKSVETWTGTIEAPGPEWRIIGTWDAEVTTFITLRPNEAGTYQEWTTFGPGSYHWDRTRDKNDATGVMVTGSTVFKETLNLDNTTQTGTINFVTARARALRENTSYVLTNSPSATTGGWTNPTNAYADGGGYASITSGTPSASQTYSGYGFNIPSGAIITQVRVRYDAWSTSIMPNFQAVGTAVSGTGSVNVSWPTHQAGDLGILVIETDGAGTTLTPSGWTHFPGSPVIDVASNAGSKLHVLWKRAASSSEPAVSTGDSGDHQVARIYTFRGVVSTGDPWDNVVTGAKTTASTTATAPSVTTTVPNTLVAIIVGRPDDSSSTTHFSNWTNPNLGNLTEQGEAGTTSGNGGGFVLTTGTKETAGPTGTTTATKSASTTDTYMTIALRPDPTPEQIRVDVSWDGGTTWSSKQTTDLNGTENTYWFDVTGATSWTPEKLNDANFRVRVDAYTVGDAGEVRLDWIAVEVTYYVVPKFKILWRTHDTDYESDDIAPTDVFADYCETRTVNPYTGSAWTWDEVNNLQIGARASALTGDDNIKVSEFWVEVVYTPPVLEWRLIETWSNNALSAPANWVAVDTWSGNVTAPANWREIDAWSGTVGAPAEWRNIETWSGDVNAPHVWRVVETWSGTVSAPIPAQWQIVESWTGDINTPVEWRTIEAWNVTLNAPAYWKEIEVWSAAVNVPANWWPIETWDGSVSAPAAWKEIETWSGTVGTLVAWTIIETWSGIVATVAGWNAVESWTGIVNAPAQWKAVEVWAGTVNSIPAVWRNVESWTGTASSVAPSWRAVESWTGNVSSILPSWRTVEAWTGEITTLPIWRTVEVWSGTVNAQAAWRIIETWTGTIGTVVAWKNIETWTASITAAAEWRAVESWTGGINTSAEWRLIETWSGSVTSAPEWRTVETWTASANAPAWRAIETWTGEVTTLPIWRMAEAWSASVGAPALGWRSVESWTGSVSSPASWRVVEGWTGEATSSAQWRAVEAWTGTVNSTIPIWRVAESWTGTVNSVIPSWRIVESWTGTVSSVIPSWRMVEAWTGNVNSVVPAWRTVEAWTGTVSPVVPAWRNIETWTANMSSILPEWGVAETWSGEIVTAPEWYAVGTWDAGISAPAPPREWRLVESWTGEIFHAFAWRIVEAWEASLQTLGWRTVEMWSAAIAVEAPRPPAPAPSPPAPRRLPLGLGSILIALSIAIGLISKKKSHREFFLFVLPVAIILVLVMLHVGAPSMLLLGLGSILIALSIAIGVMSRRKNVRQFFLFVLPAVIIIVFLMLRVEEIIVV